jgi:hypothetical protein
MRYLVSGFHHNIFSYASRQEEDIYFFFIIQWSSSDCYHFFTLRKNLSLYAATHNDNSLSLKLLLSSGCTATVNLKMCLTMFEYYDIFTIPTLWMTRMPPSSGSSDELY